MTMHSTVHAGRLTVADEQALQRLLDVEPVANVYLRSELQHGIDAGEWWGIRDGDAMRAAILAGLLAVPCIPRRGDAPALAETACAAVPPRMLVGPRDAVLALHRALLASRPAREVRDPQPLLTLDRAGAQPAAATPVRLSRRSDLDGLAVAAAAMHREEMGIDPMRIDATAWRNRMLGLIERGWSWVWREHGEVIFKAELSAHTPEAVQIQGVYTHPAWRRRGVAQAALASVCEALLREVPVCSLYVNHYNVAALGVYARLGFRQTGEFATVIY